MLIYHSSRTPLIIRHNIFPQEVELSEVIPFYKKLDPLQKQNYRPVSLLSHISKVFERIIHKQITSYMRDKLSSCITGFRNSHGTQHSLVVMLEKWKRECVSALSMNLSKAFDTTNHNLMIAKLKAYGFSRETFKFMQNYLKIRKQRVQINNKFSSERDVIVEVRRVLQMYPFFSSY